MPTFPVHTLTVTIETPFAEVVAFLADPANHPEWATEFFAGPAEPTDTPGEFEVLVPMMGGKARFRTETQARHGIVDLYLAPAGAPFGPPLPIRMLHNGDGTDVLFTLTRFPGMPEAAWEHGLV
jgi:hypothetical protein